jgi:glycosyltransferase
MKKALQLASVASMIDQFNIPNIELLLSLGYHVDVVADYTNPGNISTERAEELIKILKKMGANPIDIPIPRSLNPIAIGRAYIQVKKLLSAKHYNLIHCHSPIGGAIARLAAKSERKKGTRVLYTAHGFHFYHGAPVLNWLIFFPIELYLSKFTDVLITINKEDYHRAKNKFRAKNTVYVPGIGIDLEKFNKKNSGNIRSELGIKNEDILLLSVGELNKNKNHESVIRALGKMYKDNIFPRNLYYIIVGKGERKKELESMINAIGLKEHIKLLGFRENILDYYSAADIFVFPSFREGLSVSMMEAMGCGLPVICSKIRGNTDLIDSFGGVLFTPNNISSIYKAIKKILRIERKRNDMGAYNRQKIKGFDIKIIQNKMSKLYSQS